MDIIEFAGIDISGKTTENKQVRAASLEVAIASLAPIERLMLQAHAERRVLDYTAALIPSKADKPLDILAERVGATREGKITTPHEAQVAALLRQQYTALHAALEGYSMIGKPEKVHDMKRVKAKYVEAHARVTAVTEQGDWGPIKAELAEQVHEPKKPGLFRRGKLGPHEQAEHEHKKRMYDMHAKLHDMDRARKILQMIPDRSSPMDPAKVDPKPLVRFKTAK